jgi:hypothetical protein
MRASDKQLTVVAETRREIPRVRAQISRSSPRARFLDRMGTLDPGSPSWCDSNNENGWPLVMASRCETG